MADGISCRPEKRQTGHVDRCTLNNPCDQECTDTGVAIKCTCNDGYELAADKHTCNGDLIPNLEQKHYKPHLF